MRLGGESDAAVDGEVVSSAGVSWSSSLTLVLEVPSPGSVRGGLSVRAYSCFCFSDRCSDFQGFWSHFSRINLGLVMQASAYRLPSNSVFLPHFSLDLKGGSSSSDCVRLTTSMTLLVKEASPEGIVSKGSPSSEEMGSGYGLFFG